MMVLVLLKNICPGFSNDFTAQIEVGAEIKGVPDSD